VWQNGRTVRAMDADPFENCRDSSIPKIRRDEALTISMSVFLSLLILINNWGSFFTDRLLSIALAKAVIFLIFSRTFAEKLSVFAKINPPRALYFSFPAAR